MSSLYGAEWIQDHARVHETGACDCDVDFAPYKPTLHGVYENEYIPTLMEKERNDGSHTVAGGYARAYSEKRWAYNAPETMMSVMDRIDGPIPPEKHAFMGAPIDHQVVQFPHDRTPICGSPIGAGPEGAPHASSWEGCELSRWRTYRRTKSEP